MVFLLEWHPSCIVPFQCWKMLMTKNACKSLLTPYEFIVNKMEKKIVLPDNRPLLSLVQLGSILGQIDPLLLIFENVHFSYSPLLTTFFGMFVSSITK